MRYQSILLNIAFLLSVSVASAQYYDTGQEPSSLKWMQIKTDRFTVIYPEKDGPGGLAYAHSLDIAYSKLITLFPERKFTIPVIIHNYTIQSNGYVAWAPRRIEMYPTPEQNTIPLDPVTYLCQHELTHAFQMVSLNQGFSKVMSLFFGEQFTGVVASLLPQWFLEGDAVFAESILTGSGRGRSPSFQKQLKALIVEKGNIYRYDKVFNGSFKEYIPDYYQYGYQMVSWALVKYDPQIWISALDYTAHQPFTINPMNISLRKSIGLTKKKLFKETFDTLKTVWTKDVSESNPISYEPLNPDKHGKYIDYYSPVYAGTDTVFAVRTSLSDPPEIVLINPSEKTEKKIVTPGMLYPYVISYANGKIVWVETLPDPRWENREYSVIKVMDIHSHKITRLSRKSRYLSASISPDGSRIAATENTINNINSFVLIDTETGILLQSVPAPGNANLQHPQWAAGGGKITVISLTAAGEGIMSYTFADQQWETLVDAGRNELQSSFLRNDSLYYVSSLSGTDNIFLKTPDRKTTLITSSRFGVMDLFINGEKAFFSDCTSIGNNICSLHLANEHGMADYHISSASFLINRFNYKPKSLVDTTHIAYTPEPYRKWQHLFNFHSWMPFYADIQAIETDPVSVRPGVSVMSQNQLSTLITTTGYEYSQDKSNILHTQITWKGWYPVFQSELYYGDNQVIDKVGSNIGNPSEIQPGLRFLNIVYLPLTFYSGKFTQYLQPTITSDYRNNDVYNSATGNYDYGQTVLSGRLYFSNYFNTAVRDIYPRWAQVFDLNYSYAPFDKQIYGTDVSLMTTFYFPGIFPNNNIKIRIAGEKQVPGEYLFVNNVPFPRGYKNIVSKELDLISGDYFMPVAYPDFSLSGLLYVNRIRTNLFYDYALGTGNTYYKNGIDGLVPDYYHDYQESFRSFGFQLMADLNVLMVPYMISAGVQTAWKNFSEAPSFELVFSIDIFGLNISRRRM